MMASVLLIIDGMEDIEYPELDGKSPFSYANCKNISLADTQGLVGTIDTIPKGCPPDSLYCISYLLGVDVHFNGRAYFEALAVGLEMEPDDFILRCNIVVVNGGIVTSSCGAGLCEAEMKKRALSTADLLPRDYSIHHMGSYKNILLQKHGQDSLKGFKTFAPHQNIGRPLCELLPYGSQAADELAEFVNRSHKHLGDYAILPWGESVVTHMPKFESLQGLPGAAICKTEIAVGIARSIGMYTPDIEGATGDADTDLDAKLAEAVRCMKKYDFVCVHVNGADEAGHRKDHFEKSGFIKKVDDVLAGGLMDAMQEGDSILVCSDHATVCRTGGHTDGPVKFWLLKKGADLGGKNVGQIIGKDVVRTVMEYSG